MPYREIQKLLGGNRVTLPAEFVKRNKMVQGDTLIVEWDDYGRVTIMRGEVKPKTSFAEVEDLRKKEAKL